MCEALGHYAAIRIGNARHKPSIARISKKKLNMLDKTMRQAGYDEYDLGIIWADVPWAWVLYASAMFDDQG